MTPSQRNKIPVLIVCLLAGFLVILFAKNTPPQIAQAGDISSAASSLLSFSPPLTGTWAINPNTSSAFVVLRAYFEHPQMVADLAAWMEPWEVNYQKGYVVVGVTPLEYDLLQQAGFVLEIDHELTTYYNQIRTDPPDYAPTYDTIPGFACYRTVEGTFNTAIDIVAAYPDLAAFVDVGDSWEKETPGGLPGYDMMVLILTNHNTAGPKPKLFITSAIHAREYTTAELATRFAEYLVAQVQCGPGCHLAAGLLRNPSDAAHQPGRA